jgi:hypothetical protein
MQWLLDLLERQGAVIRDAFPSFVLVCLVAMVVLYFVFERLYKARLESKDAFNASLKDRLELQEKSQPQTPNTWLTDAAENDRRELQNAVNVLECNLHETLTPEDSHVTFDFLIRNGSLYAITVDPNIKGFITLNTRKLVGEISTSKLPHNLPRIHLDRFQIRQDLTPKDVEELNTLDSAMQLQGYYDFANLHITIQGDSPAGKAVPTRLQFRRVTRRPIGNGFELV